MSEDFYIGLMVGFAGLWMYKLANSYLLYAVRKNNLWVMLLHMCIYAVVVYGAIQLLGSISRVMNT